MAVSAFTLFRCKWALKQSPALKRNLTSFVPRLASIKSLELKPLRTINRSIGSSRQSNSPVAQLSDSSPKQFPRPGVVAYDRSIANSINLIGNVGVNPDIVYQDSGEIFATSSLSVKKDPKAEPSWYFLEFQSDLAEIAVQHIRKGDRIHVAGRVNVEIVMLPVPSGEPKEDKLIKVHVTELHFVDDVYGAQAVPATTSSASSAATQAPKKTPGSSAEKRQAAEKLWKVFFENPANWYDNRVDKRNPKAPDFKHKTTGDALWIDGYYVPSYVKEKISELEGEGAITKLDGRSFSSGASSSNISSTTEFNVF